MTRIGGLACSLALVLLACGGSTASGAGGSGSGSGSGSSSGSGSGSSSGSSGGGAVLPDAFVAATVGVGPQSPASGCNLAGSQTTYLAIGAPGGAKPTTVQDGQTTSSGPVSVQCSVKAVGSGFDVDLRAGIAGTGGSSIRIQSPAGQGAVTASGATGILGVLQSSAQASYTSSDCNLAFTYQGQPVLDVPAIAPGRIWAHLSCPAATSASGQGTQCDAEADFLFELCDQ